MAATISKSDATRHDGASIKARKVCVLVYDGLCTFEYAIAVEVFARPRADIENWYEFEAVAIEKGVIQGAGNVSVTGNTDMSTLYDADIILVPGWRSADNYIPQDLRDALLVAHRNGTRIASICSGVFVLAQCGLLEGKHATTHWQYTSILKSMYPNIIVDTDVLYVDEGQILTSAGSVAGVDLCLRIVRNDFGASIAKDVARRLVMPAHRDGGQAQFITRSAPKFYRGNIAPLLEQILENLNEDWGVERMAGETHSSARTLQRRFKDATGASPHMWVTNARIDLAKDLLETTTLNVQQIANVTGLKTPETVRHHFKRLTGLSPTRYRSKFRQTG